MSAAAIPKNSYYHLSSVRVLVNWFAGDKACMIQEHKTMSELIGEPRVNL